MTFSESTPRMSAIFGVLSDIVVEMLDFVTNSEYAPKIADILGVNMYQRILKLPKNHHLFLFGARNTGKSTLIEENFSTENTFFIDLLDQEEEDKYLQSPNELLRVVDGLPPSVTHVVIDEIQKAPKLLNLVQKLMRSTDKTFIMTGSSARKLKRGGANLLAGRAWVYNLFPLTATELDEDFDLNSALRWGTLPEAILATTDQGKAEFLNSYAHTYLKEEIWDEHIVQTLPPFRKFLEVAAQSNGKIINYANIARDVGVDDKTIKSYYAILEDTLIGFFLEPYQNSFRKRLSKKPKFYFFDPGIVRALLRLSSVPLSPQTNAYGNAFEHFIILECIRLASYARKDFRFNFLRTPNDAKIDLIVERPGQPLLCIEIQSSQQVMAEDITSFRKLTAEMPNCEAVVFSQDKYAKKIEHVMVLPWMVGLGEVFG